MEDADSQQTGAVLDDERSRSPHVEDVGQPVVFTVNCCSARFEGANVAGPEVRAAYCAADLEFQLAIAKSQKA
jgi:hypothetical protein